MKKGIKIKIIGKFGSKFQEKFASDSLINILKTWKGFVNNSHKKNQIIIELNDNDLDFF